MGASDNTKTTIINMALAHCKVSPITSPDDASEPARKGNLFYDKARRSALRACDWNWAEQNVSLAVLGSVDNPNFDPTFAMPQDVVPGWLYCYGVPGQCLRVRKLYSPQTPDSLPLPYIDRTIHDRVQELLLNDVQFRVMRSPLTNQSCIVTNLKGAWASFTLDVKDESQFDDEFVDAFSYELALKLCLPLTADKELVQIIKSARDEFIGEAKRKNGGEGTERLPRASNYEAART